MILSQKNIEEIAVAVIRDFQKSFFGSEADDPTRFAIPTPIDQFASDYLNLRVSFQKLSSDGSIYGLTAYVDTEYQIEVDGSQRSIFLKTNDVVLDKSFIEPENIRKLCGKRRFTLAHECAHQILFQLDADDRKIACHKRPEVRKKGSRVLRTQEDWNEWQANSLGAAILMPQSEVDRAMWFINSQKDEGLRPHHLQSYGNPVEQTWQKVYQAYQEACDRAGLVDFAELLLRAHELWLNKPHILQHYRERFTNILVDEFQDINLLQYQVVRMLALPENNLFIVGDDDQSIYRFRGAKPEIMLGFEKDFPGTKRVLLGTNYRSTKEIVETSLKLIGHNKVRFEKKLEPFRGSGRPVDFRVFDNPGHEMDTVAQSIRAYHDAGYAWNEIAVLFRTGANSGLMAERLMGYNIPFQLRDVIPNLYSHWIAKDLFAYMEIAAGSRKRSDFYRIMNRPNRYFSRDAFDTPTVSFDRLKSFYQDRDWMEDRICDLEADLRTMSRLKPVAAVNYIRKVIGYDDYLRSYAEFRRMKPEELFETADKLAESAAEFETFEAWKEHAVRYEEELKKQNLEETREARDRVTLSTMHSAKGLEYPVVFVVDVNEGIVPHHKAGLPAASL